MIFVILGTQKFSFDRIVKEVNRLVANGTIKEKVIIQSGTTDVESRLDGLVEVIPFMEKKVFESYIEKAEYIICHGGTGAIISSIKAHKKVISVARLEKYNEHVDNHQLEIVDEFTSSQLILSGGVTDLERLINELAEFEPLEYKSNTSQILGIINSHIDNL